MDAVKSWSIFTADVEGKVCWIVSEPTKSVARKNGKRVQVNRGDIYLMVAVRPGSGDKNQVSMVSGYPYKPGEAVVAKIGSAKFEMFSKGENAWLDGPSEDDKMVVAMKKGITAVVTGTSSRGTDTEDTFSLRGFTAAIGKSEQGDGWRRYLKVMQLEQSIASGPHTAGDARQDLAREILEMSGYRVLAAPHGGEALLLCERHRGAIELMVTDVLMPHMTGRELYDRLAPLRPDMKVLFMSV